LWLTVINGVVFTPAPDPLVAGGVDYNLTFTLEAGDPQDLGVALTERQVELQLSPIHFFNSQSSQTFEAKKLHLFPFTQGCVSMHS
jgi:hypothetical protein